MRRQSVRLSKQHLISGTWLALLSLAWAGSLRLGGPVDAPFYPLNLIYLLLPPSLAQGFLGFVEEALWVSGLYLLARTQGASRFSALLAATLGASARQSLGLTSSALPWLPWSAVLVWCTQHQHPWFGQKTRLPWVLLSALPLAAMFSGEDGETARLTAVTLGLVALHTARRERSTALLFGLALLLGWGLSAPHLTLPEPPLLHGFSVPVLSWQTLGHLLLLVAWSTAWQQRKLPLELAGLGLSLALTLLGFDARGFMVMAWSLGAARGADAVRALRLTHGPDGGTFPPPAASPLISWFILKTRPLPLAYLAGAAFWSGWALLLIAPLQAANWLMSGIVLRVARCPIYVPRSAKRRPVWEVLALGVAALPLLTFLAWPATTPGADGKAFLLTWWTEAPLARPTLFITFLSAMSMAFLAVLWTWYRFYGSFDANSDLLRVARNSSVPVILNLFNRGMDFAYAALLLLRLLGPANAGDYSSAIVIYTWLEILVNFGLDAIMIRELARAPQESARYLYNAALVRLRLWLLFLPAVSGLCWLGPLPAQTRAALAMLYLALVPATLCKNFDALFYAHEQVAYPALVSSIATFIKVSLGALVLLSGRGIVFLAANALLTNLIVLAILSMLARRHITPLRRVPDASLRQSLLALAWPLMLRDLLYALYYRIDLLLLQVLQSSLIAGWYSVIFKFLDTVTVVPQYFALALFPILARQAFQDRERFLHDYRLSVKVLLTLAFPLALGVTLYARELVLILGDVAYLPHSAIALRLAIWLILLNWINALGQYALIALQRQKTLSLILGIGLGLSVIGNVMLVPTYSYVASALLKVGVEALMWGMQTLVLRHSAGRLGWRSLLKRFIPIILFSVAIAWFVHPLSRALAFGLALIGYGMFLWKGHFFSPQEWFTLRRLRLRRPEAQP